MRVLHTLDNSNVGGIQELILNLSLHDKANVHDFWAADGSMADIMRRAGMILWTTPPQELIDSHYYQFVVGHTVAGWSHENLFTWARSMGAKTIECLHSPAKSPTPPSLVDGFIALNHIAADLNRHMPRVRVIYALVDVDKFGPGSREYIGRLSRLVDEKRPQDFVTLARAYPDSKFVMAGDGPLMSQMMADAPDNLYLPGMVRDFPAFYGTLRLFVFPTRDECCSVAVAMAQASGVPCVVQDIPALRESTNGRAFFASDEAGFRRWIDEFLGQPNLNKHNTTVFDRVGEDGRTWAYRAFDKRAVVPAWNALFREVMSEAN